MERSISEISDLNIIILLQLIRSNSNVKFLFDRGLSYLQINHLVSRAIKEGLIVVGDDATIITERGNGLLRSHYAKHRWIFPEENSRILKIDISDIYIPSRNSIKFL
ncbi:hypothetical protein [Desulfomicrobium salsuginis]